MYIFFIQTRSCVIYLLLRFPAEGLLLRVEYEPILFSRTIKCQFSNLIKKQLDVFISTFIHYYF